MLALALFLVATTAVPPEPSAADALAVKKIADRPGLTVGLDSLLDL